MARTSFVLLMFLALPTWAAQFQKTNQRDLISLKGEAKVSLEEQLQTAKIRSTDALRVSFGSSIGTRAVGPNIQAEWQKTMTRSWLLSSGLGYSLETRSNQKGESRNFHQVPVFAAAGYRIRPVAGWSILGQAGPALRMVFERGFSLEQAQDYSYGDVLVQMSVDYEWLTAMTQAGRSIGLRYSRFLGLSGTPAAQPIDSILASFSFDI